MWTHIHVHSHKHTHTLMNTHTLVNTHTQTHTFTNTYTHTHTWTHTGTIFLWIFWPSFNGALASGNAQYRAIINTYYSMTAGVMATIIFSIGFDGKNRKISMV